MSLLFFLKSPSKGFLTSRLLPITNYLAKGMPNLYWRISKIYKILILNWLYGKCTNGVLFSFYLFVAFFFSSYFCYNINIANSKIMKKLLFIIVFAFAFLNLTKANVTEVNVPIVMTQINWQSNWRTWRIAQVSWSHFACLSKRQHYLFWRISRRMCRHTFIK